MKFFIKKPFKYKGQSYSRRDRYIEMPYEDAKKEKLILLRKVMKSGDNPKVSEQPKEVKQNEEILEKTGADAPKPARSAKSRRRSGKSRLEV